MQLCLRGHTVLGTSGGISHRSGACPSITHSLLLSKIAGCSKNDNDSIILQFYAPEFEGWYKSAGKSTAEEQDKKRSTLVLRKKLHFKWCSG